MQDKDLLYPSLTKERSRHKKKRLVQSPNSYFMDVKCTGCYKDHHHLQPCSDSGTLCRLLFNPLSTSRGEMQTN